jgi:hypothetical protein
MTGEEDRSVITQPEAVPLIHVPILEPSVTSQKVRNTDTFRGAHAPAWDVSCDTLSSAGLIIGAPSFEHGDQALLSLAGQTERKEDQHRQPYNAFQIPGSK